MCIAACCIFTNCETQTPEQKKAADSKMIQNEVSLIELTFNGETHEYIWFHMDSGQYSKGSVAHWAGCKYCKEKNINNTNNYSLW